MQTIKSILILISPIPPSRLPCPSTPTSPSTPHLGHDRADLGGQLGVLTEEIGVAGRQHVPGRGQQGGQRRHLLLDAAHLPLHHLGDAALQSRHLGTASVITVIVVVFIFIFKFIAGFVSWLLNFFFFFFTMEM